MIKFIKRIFSRKPTLKKTLLQNFDVFETQFERDIKSLNFKMDLEYQFRMTEYEAHVEELRVQREKFYREHPDCPYKTMFMNVVAPPAKFSITIVK